MSVPDKQGESFGKSCSFQVPYNITGWLEKNIDPLKDTVVDQLKKGSNELIVEVCLEYGYQANYILKIIIHPFTDLG